MSFEREEPLSAEERRDAIAWAMSIVLAECEQQGLYPLILIAGDETRQVIFPCGPGADAFSVARLLRDAAAHMDTLDEQGGPGHLPANWRN